MTIDQDKQATNGLRYFKFEHSSTYRQIQMKFIQAVESFDPENLIVSIETLIYFYGKINFVFLYGNNITFYFLEYYQSIWLPRGHFHTIIRVLQDK